MGTFFSKSAILSNPLEFATCVDGDANNGASHLNAHTSWKTYDYVIVGAGAAGPVLAHRLSENPEISVLLIEAGYKNDDTPFSSIPAAYGKLFRSKYDWENYTVPQPECHHRVMYQPRGKLLGGSTSMNAMMYQRACETDLIEWQNIGATGWGPDDMAPYFKLSQKHTPHVEFPDIEHKDRGNAGLWQTGYTWTADISKQFLRACLEFGLPHTPDINKSKGSIIGALRMLTFIDSKGARSSAATAYLGKDVVRRPNLTVAVKTHVTRVLFSSDNTKAVGVEMAQTPTGKRYKVAAAKEVILCAGAFNTPQILNLSGIGAANDLERLGIPVLKHLPAVGQNLYDHISTGTLIFKAKAGSCLDYMYNPLKGLPAIIRWFVTGAGPATSNIGEIAAFFRANDPAYSSIIDPPGSKPLLYDECASGPGAPDIEMIGLPLAVLRHGQERAPADVSDCYSILSMVLRPKSKGTVKLASKSPFDHVIVDPAYLSHPNDIKVLIRAVRIMLHIVRQPSMAKWLSFSPGPYASDPFWPGNADPNTLTDAMIEKWIRENSETLYHPVSTCRMGNDENDSVLDSALRVRGVDCLRVCDASAFPTQISGHPTATIIAMAEKLSAMILASESNKE